MSNDRSKAIVAIWEGELLWPKSLADEPIIDLSGVVALGTWAYDWFRQRPQRAVVGASQSLKRQLTRAHLPILFYGQLDQVPQQHAHAENPNRVSSDERALLWGFEDG